MTGTGITLFIWLASASPTPMTVDGFADVAACEKFAGVFLKDAGRGHEWSPQHDRPSEFGHICIRRVIGVLRSRSRGKVGTRAAGGLN